MNKRRLLISIFLSAILSIITVELLKIAKFTSYNLSSDLLKILTSYFIILIFSGQIIPFYILLSEIKKKSEWLYASIGIIFFEIFLLFHYSNTLFSMHILSWVGFILISVAEMIFYKRKVRIIKALKEGILKACFLGFLFSIILREILLKKMDLGYYALTYIRPPLKYNYFILSLTLAIAGFFYIILLDFKKKSIWFYTAIASIVIELLWVTRELQSMTYAHGFEGIGITLILLLFMIISLLEVAIYKKL